MPIGGVSLPLSDRGSGLAHPFLLFQRGRGRTRVWQSCHSKHALLWREHGNACLAPQAPLGSLPKRRNRSTKPPALSPPGRARKWHHNVTGGSDDTAPGAEAVSYAPARAISTWCSLPWAQRRSTSSQVQGKVVHLSMGVYTHRPPGMWGGTHFRHTPLLHLSSQCLRRLRRVKGRRDQGWGKSFTSVKWEDPQKG